MYRKLGLNPVKQIQELVNYVVRNRSEEDRAAFIKPFQDALKTGEGQKPLEEDIDRRKKIFLMVLNQVKGLGDGSEKGAVRHICGCSNDKILTK